MPSNNQGRNTVSPDSCYDSVYKTNETLHTNYNVELTNIKMAAHVALNLFNHQNKMAILKEIPAELNYNRIEKIIDDTPDEPDKPSSYYVERAISDENARNQELFDIMKYEVNRLNSFTGKWPLCYIKPKELAQNGFFYLQSEDKVQCAFCGIIIDDWNVGDKPVKKHMMRNPRCKFLLTADAGNVPFTKPKPVAKTVNKCIPNTNATNTLSHKPKYPRMSDIKNRLLSYRDWPLLMLSSRQLAECGLFYTGVGDVVTCFYCGRSLHQWELNDDPWVEHEKSYPDCGFLDLVKTRIKPTPSFAPVNHVSVKSNSPSARPFAVSDNSVPNEVIRQACEIFPDSLVQKVAIRHFQKTGKHFTSLHDLCDAILQYKAQEQSALTNTMSPQDLHKSVSGDVTSNGVPMLSDGFQIHVENNSVSPLLNAGILESEEPNGIYANPDECEKFITCDDGKPTVFEYSKGKVFDVNRKKCTPKKEVSCKIDPQNELPAISPP